MAKFLTSGRQGRGNNKAVWAVFISQHETVLLSEASRTVLGPIQPSIQWVVRTLSLE
jgi:hypothetical protein